MTFEGSSIKDGGTKKRLSMGNGSGSDRRIF